MKSCTETKKLLTKIKTNSHNCALESFSKIFKWKTLPPLGRKVPVGQYTQEYVFFFFKKKKKIETSSISHATYEG